MTREAEDSNLCREENRGRSLFIQIVVDFILLLAGNYIYSFILILFLMLMLFTKLFLPTKGKGINVMFEWRSIYTCIM